MFRCSCFMYLRNKRISLTREREALWARTCERCFCLRLFRSRGAIHKNTSRMVTLLPNSGKLCRTSDRRWPSSSWRTASVHACHPKKRGSTSCATLAVCVSKKTVHVSHFLCPASAVVCMCVSFSRTLPSSRRVPGGGIALLQYLARITLKTFLESPFSSRTNSSPSSSSSTVS